MLKLVKSSAVAEVPRMQNGRLDELTSFVDTIFMEEGHWKIQELHLNYGKVARRTSTCPNSTIDGRPITIITIFRHVRPRWISIYGMLQKLCPEMRFEIQLWYQMKPVILCDGHYMKELTLIIIHDIAQLSVQVQRAAQDMAYANCSKSHMLGQYKTGVANLLT
ncbi:hypothetical protein Cgig2_025261 [Carnegiea gigantea]|uniref:Uncharacterized protein n=1 Tax=Carnegiea gigantea TaxID=171969 RepID=A0A9Q1JPH0_9CARY|nr:hypothetical protein Cgig2_025261 [Carnegiea gigantea]